MATHLVRYAARRPHPLGRRARQPASRRSTETTPRTASLIERRRARLARGGDRAPSLEVAAVTLLSPVTAPARVICQGANYRQHMIESGVDPDAKRFNMFFEKSDASISAPGGLDRAPGARAAARLRDRARARLPKKPITGPVTVTADDVARVRLRHDDRQRRVRPRRAAPADPVLQGQELSRLLPARTVPRGARAARSCATSTSSTLTLEVNDIVRQRDSTREPRLQAGRDASPSSPRSAISRPATCCSPGTPAGCALRAPTRSGAQPDAARAVRSRGCGRRSRACRRSAPQYLKPGDVVRATIASEDRAIDLGEQRHVSRRRRREGFAQRRRPPDARRPRAERAHRDAASSRRRSACSPSAGPMRR